jgi:hypothetical protein
MRYKVPRSGLNDKTVSTRATQPVHVNFGNFENFGGLRGRNFGNFGNFEDGEVWYEVEIRERREMLPRS